MLAPVTNVFSTSYFFVVVVMSKSFPITLGSWRILGVTPNADGQPRKVKIKVRS